MSEEQKISAAKLAFIALGQTSVVIFIIGMWEDQSSTTIIGALGILICIILPITLYLLKNVLMGVVLQFSWAKSSNGFVGVIVFIFSWLLIMPIMIIWALIWGTMSRHEVTI